MDMSYENLINVIIKWSIEAKKIKYNIFVPFYIQTSSILQLLTSMLKLSNSEKNCT